MGDECCPPSSSFAHSLEQCALIRSRFRRQVSWLQWPTAVVSQEEDGDIERHPICTKSLRLNVDAVRLMVEFYHGDFEDIHALTAEADQL